MENKKKWNKISPGKYALVQNGSVLGEIDRAKTTELYNVLLGQQKYKISSSGLLSQKVEIRDINGTLVLKMEPEKWYSSYYSLMFNETKYKLIIRNNPLSEFVVVYENTELVAYGLDMLKESNKLAVRVIEKDSHQPLLFHALLWYLFEPLSYENSGDDLWWTWGL
jgi:hypothetical protein